MTLSAILVALGLLPVFHEDRAPEFAEAKRAQTQAIARSLTRHAKSRSEAALVITLGAYESGLSLRVMAGRCRPLECDKGLARGLIQEHRNGRPQADWDRLHGLENIDFQVESAVRRARGMLRMCGSAEGAMRAMTGRGCDAPLPGIEKRVVTYRRVLKGLS